MQKTTTNAPFDFQFYRWEKEFKDRPFLRQPFGDRWEEYSWGEVGQMARKLATGLRSLGLRDNAHIGLISKNCREWIIADLAIMMAGYISVPFYPTLNDKELNTLLEFGDVDLLFVGKVEHWEQQKKGVPKDMPVIAFPPYANHSPAPEAIQWFDFIDQHPPLETPHQPMVNDTWTIIFTSGTTGDPKGVVLNYLANEKTALLTLESNPLEIDFNGKNDFFSYLPLNHIAERVVVEFGVFRFGGTISFVESIDTFAQNLQQAQPTVFFAVPRIWTKFQMGVLAKLPQPKLEKLLKIPLLSGFIKRKLRKGLGLHRARAIVSGAAPLLDSQREWFRSIGIPITNGYGMTENCAITTQLPAPISNKPGSVGIPQPEVDIKIDPETSEIMMRGPFVMVGYYKQPELTAQVLQDGWLRTGDQGYLDSDGFLYITGRVKDIFKTSKGKYIEPLVLESYFADIVDFEQMCIVGLGLPQPIGLVVLSEVGKSKDKNELTAQLEQTLKNVNNKLESYKKISTLILTDEEWTVENGLTTPTLKIKRNAIDKKYEKNYKAWYDREETVLMM